MTTMPRGPMCPRCKNAPLLSGEKICSDCAIAERETDSTVATPAPASAPRRGQPSPGAPRPTAAAQQHPLPAAAKPAPAAQAPKPQPKPVEQPKQAPAAAPADPHPNAPGNDQSAPPPTAPADSPAPLPKPIDAGRALERGRPAARPSALGSAMPQPVCTPDVDEGLKFVIYGPGGVGKTSLAWAIPNVTVIPLESTPGAGTVHRWPGVDTLEKFLYVVRWLKTEQHDHKTLAIDSADELESLIMRACVARSNERNENNGVDSETIEHVGGGYKKGYTAATAKWREVLAELDQLRVARGMTIFFTAHETLVKRTNVLGVDDYDGYTLNLHEQAGRPLVHHWADAVLFFNYVTRTHKQGRKGRAKGIGGRERALYTQNADAYVAKNRFDMPPQMRTDGGAAEVWAQISHRIEQWKSPQLLRQAIDEALAELGDMTVEVKGELYLIKDLAAYQLASNPSKQKLAQLKNRLEARVAEKEEAAERAADEAAAAAEGAQ